MRSVRNISLKLHVFMEPGVPGGKMDLEGLGEKFVDPLSVLIDVI